MRGSRFGVALFPLYGPLVISHSQRRVETAKLRTFVGWCTIFFALHLPPFTVAFFIMSQQTFTSFSLLYLGEVSIIALVAGFGSWWQSLQVQIHQEEDADVQEVLDVVKEVAHGNPANPHDS